MRATLIRCLALCLSAGVPALPAAPAAPKKPASAKAPAPGYKDLKFPPLGQIRIPEVASFTLANGMKLYLLENHELPLVSGFALVRTGNLFDPADKVGLAEMTGTVMRTGGTASKTGDELDEQLENIAASVESGIGETSGRVSFSALRENTDEVLGVFKEVLTAPVFRQDKIDLIKMQLRSTIARRNDDAGSVAAREFTNIVYGRNTPYGWSLEYEHVDRIRREDLEAFYRRYFFPANVMLAVYGDFKAGEMREKIEKLFGGWNHTQPPVPAFPPVAAKPAPGVYLAEKDDVTQTFFRLGHLGGVLRDRNYPALEVMADILGGGFRSRLVRKVRTELGYAYNVGASWGANYGHPGLFEISGSTKSASTVDALQVIRQEVERIRTTEVSAEELEAAKQTVLNSFVFHFDTPGKTLSRLIIYEYYGYPKDFIFGYQKAVASVTAADIKRVASEFLRPENFTVVAAGNPKDFGRPLAELGMAVSRLDLTIPEPKRETARADAAGLQKARAALARMQAAVGGAARLAEVKDVTQRATVLIQAGAGTLKASQTNRLLLPGHFRQDSELPFGKMATYFDGKSGWMAGPQGSGTLPPAAARQAQTEVFRNLFRLLLADRDPACSVNMTRPAAVEISSPLGDVITLEFDEQTGLPTRQTYQLPQTGSVEEIYGGWKESGGLRLPHEITVMRNGQKFADVTIEEVRINTGLTIEELEKKP